MRLTLLGLALVALAATPAPALGAPTWLDETAPYGDVPAQMQQADAAMAPDGTVVFARFAPGGALEVRERPPGGTVGATVTIEPVTVNAQPFPELQVLTGADGTAAVLFDAGNVRYATLRPPGGRWGRPEPLMPSRAGRGQVALSPDGVLWGVGELSGELNVFRLPHQAPIPLPRSPRIDADSPVLTAPRAGVAHVVYVERFDDTTGPLCSAVTFLRAVDVTAAGPGPKKTLDAYAFEGRQGANECAQATGDVLFPGPRLTGDAAGGENVVYGVLAVDGSAQTWLARHRDAGGEWPVPLEAPEVVAENTELRDVAGPAVVLGGDGDEGLTVAVRGGDGRWRPAPLTGRTWISKLRAVHSGAGSTVFAWSEGVAGGAARARVLGADGALGAPAELNGGGTNVLGLGADAQGNAVALYSVQRPDLSFRLAARGLDAAGPRLTLSAPERGSVGAPLQFAADVFDVWSASRVAWDFGDGAVADGPRVVHAFRGPGAFTVRARAVDAVGNATDAARGVTIDAPPPPPPPPPPDTRPPAVTRVRVTPGRPATLAFATDEAGRARATLAKVCKRCPRRSVARVVGAGAARIPLGRLSPGMWRITLTVTDAAGNTSPAATRTVRITRGPSARAGL